MLYFLGEGFLKICLNLVKEDDEFSSPNAKKMASAHQKPKKWTYADIYGNMFKDSSANGTIILAIAERVSESHDNLALLLGLIGLTSAEIGDFMNTEGRNFILL